MRKARFTEHQIIAVIKSVEAGRTVKDVCREAGISEATYYNWKSKYSGMEASDIKKVKDLEDENSSPSVAVIELTETGDQFRRLNGSCLCRIGRPQSEEHCNRQCGYSCFF